MNISGFTFVRNAIKFDYPVIESIMSILPLCNEFIVLVGNSEDKTFELIKSINSPKIKIVKSFWNDNMRNGGKVLAMETNKALANISPKADWAFYIQADEVLHEKYLDVVYKEMESNLSNADLDGFLLGFKHFYASYKYIANSQNWYRNEIRIIRNTPRIYSYRDAQGFRKNINQKLQVKKIDAYIYHYGWVKHPINQLQKRVNFNKLWHSDDVSKDYLNEGQFDYAKNIDSLALFDGTHPSVMNERINNMNWDFTFRDDSIKMSKIKKIRLLIEKLFGYRIGEYKNYKLIKPK